MTDVGIAEQHAVTFAAGLAAEGLKPFVAIYSSFMQRAFDQVAHDVALQNLPVRFILDRAGYVGADGATHHGAFDMSFMSILPNMVVMAPSDEAELAQMVKTAADYDHGPISIRFPRGTGPGVDMPNTLQALPIGQGRVVKEGSDVAILSIGTRLTDALRAADMLEADGVSVTVADARFVKPLDVGLVDRLVENHQALIVIEEGSIGGFGSFVLDYIVNSGGLEGGCRVRTLHMPDHYLEQDTQAGQIKDAGLDADSIAKTALTLLGRG